MWEISYLIKIFLNYIFIFVFISVVKSIFNMVLNLMYEIIDCLIFVVDIFKIMGYILSVFCIYILKDYY